MTTILYISHEHDKIAGSTLSLYNLIHSLPQDYQAIVLLPSTGVVYDYFTSKGIECIVAKYHVDFVGWGYSYKYFLTFPIRLIRDWFDNSKAIRKVINTLKNKHIDIIHTNTSVIDFGPQIAHKLKIPHVWHLREFIDLDMGFQPFLGWTRLRKKISRSDAIISITKAIARHYHVQDHPRATIMFDAVRSRTQLLYSEKKEPYFVFCGQIAPHKGPEIAIHAFNMFCKKHPEYQLKFLGGYEDNYKEKLLSLANETTREKIHFSGFVKNVEETISQATALLMCSRNEAQGRVTIEAMLMSCPVIAAAAGGTLEIVCNEETGLLFETPENCYEAMDRIVTDKNLASYIQKQALDFAKTFFLEETYGEQLTQIYKNVINYKKEHVI